MSLELQWPNIEKNYETVLRKKLKYIAHPPLKSSRSIHPADGVHNSRTAL